MPRISRGVDPEECGTYEEDTLSGPGEPMRAYVGSAEARRYAMSGTSAYRCAPTRWTTSILVGIVANTVCGAQASVPIGCGALRITSLAGEGEEAEEAP
jgi:hypothetical protein